MRVDMTHFTFLQLALMCANFLQFIPSAKITTETRICSTSLTPLQEKLKIYACYRLNDGVKFKLVLMLNTFILPQ